MKFRLAGVFLVIFVMIALSACGPIQPSDSNEKTAQVADTSQSASNAVDETDPFSMYEKPVTFTIGKTITALVGNPGDTLDSNDWTRYIEKKLNVFQKIAWQVDADNYEQKISLLISSNDLPDVVITSSRSTLKQMVDNELVADLTDAYNKSAAPYLKDTYDTFDGRCLKTATFDGKLMALPSTSLGGEHNLLWVRKDWMDKLNLQPPKTLDDIIAIAKAFMEKDPGGNGPGKTIGLVGYRDVAGYYGGQYGFDTIFSLYGAYPRQWMKDSSGKAVYGSTAPEMKTALAKLNEMYEDGIIDKQFPVRDDVAPLVNSGTNGMFFAPWWTAYWPLPDGFTNNPKIQWDVYPAPLDSNGKLKVYTQNPSGSYLVVKKGYEHPEAIVKIINAQMAAFLGTDPEGVKIYTDKPDRLFGFIPIPLTIDDEDIVKKCYEELTIAVNAKDPSNLKRMDFKNMYDNIMKNRENPGTDAAAWAEDLARMVAQKYTFSDEIERHESVFFGLTPTMETKWETLKKLEDETLLKIIVGEVPVSDFDKFVEQWKKLGGDQITEEVNKEINN